MTKTPIIKSGQSYTFRSYFEMKYEPEDILAEFGYRLERSRLNLPQFSGQIDQLPILKAKLQQRLTYVSLTSEAARREILIAPILLDVAEASQSQLRIEYPLNVNDQLKGSLDYYLYREQQFFVVEAKHADLARGFTQLAVELIALDQWLGTEQPILQGAVTTGDVWQFGQLNRAQKLIIQGVKLYLVPDELDDLFRILMAALIPL